MESRPRTTRPATICATVYHKPRQPRCWLQLLSARLLVHVQASRPRSADLHRRHNFISHALAGGRTLGEVKAAASHSSLMTTSADLHIAVDGNRTRCIK